MHARAARPSASGTRSITPHCYVCAAACRRCFSACRELMHGQDREHDALDPTAGAPAYYRPRDGRCPRHRSRDDQLGRRHRDTDRRRVHPRSARRARASLGGGVSVERRRRRRCRRKALQADRAAARHPFGEAVHRPEHPRAARAARDDGRSLQGRRGAEPAADRRRARSPDDDAGDLVARAAASQAHARSASSARRSRTRSSRCPANFTDGQRTGDQGGRPARRARGDAAHQRADRRGARVRLRPGSPADDRGVRFRRRHVRRLASCASPARCSRCSRPTATSSSAATISIARSPRCSPRSATASCASIRARMRR